MIYLDNHSTTRVDPRVVSSMLPYFSERFGNPASRTHLYGWEAEDAVEEARSSVAELIRATPSEIVFTSGGTESNNLAIKGAALANCTRGCHIVTTTIEHDSVLRSCESLQSLGFMTTYISVRSDGLIDPNQFEEAIRSDTVLASVMLVNHEIGTINPIKDIGRICEGAGIAFHVDAVQALGKIDVNVEDLNCDLLSLSGHKIYGPKGVGALFVRQKVNPVDMVPIIHGGGQERGLRSGTVAVPQVVGFGCAARIAMREGALESARIKNLRDHLLSRLLNEVEGIIINGSLENRIGGNLSVSFPCLEGDAIDVFMRGLAAREIAVSSGSACSSGSLDPSHVLLAIGVEPRLASATVRFGLGRFNTQNDIDYTIESIMELL